MVTFSQLTELIYGRRERNSYLVQEILLSSTNITGLNPCLRGIRMTFRFHILLKNNNIGIDRAYFHSKTANPWNKIAIKTLI